MDKILFIHQRNDFTGSTRVLANVIETEFSEQQVSIITIAGNGFLTSLPNVRIIPISYLVFRGKKIPFITSLLWQLQAWILTLYYGWNYNTFYINTIIPYYAAIIGRIYGKKIVYHVHEKFVTKSFYVTVAEYVFNHVKSKRIFVSEYLKKQYPAKANCYSIVKYNTLPVSFLSKVKMIPIKNRELKNLLMITSLTKAKGIITYIEVAKRLPQYTFRLLISADMKTIMDFLHCEVPNNMKIIPKQSDIHPFLRTSDLLLNLSIPSLCIETFGMTILEAMAYGIPAVVPNVGGPVELIINGYNGYCIDVTDVDAVSETIQKALSIKKYEYLAKNSIERLKSFT